MPMLYNNIGSAAARGANICVPAPYAEAKIGARSVRLQELCSLTTYENLGSAPSSAGRRAALGRSPAHRGPLTAGPT